MSNEMPMAVKLINVIMFFMLHASGIHTATTFHTNVHLHYIITFAFANYFTIAIKVIVSVVPESCCFP
jgi:hypothetical protein